MANRTHTVLITLVCAVFSVVTACGDDSAGAAVTTGASEATQSLVQDGVLTGNLEMEFPLGGGEAIVRAVEVELDDGSIVMAEWQSAVSEEMFAGMRVGASKFSNSDDYEWRVDARWWDGTLTGRVLPEGASSVGAEAVEVELERSQCCGRTVSRAWEGCDRAP